MEHAVGRTVDGRLGVGAIIGRNGHRIDQVGGKGARLGHGGFGKALRALGIATEVDKLRHDCNLKKYPVQKINAPGRKHRPMGAPRRGRAQIIPEM